MSRAEPEHTDSVSKKEQKKCLTTTLRVSSPRWHLLTDEIGTALLQDHSVRLMQPMCCQMWTHCRWHYGDGLVKINSHLCSTRQTVFPFQLFFPGTISPFVMYMQCKVAVNISRGWMCSFERRLVWCLAIHDWWMNSSCSVNSTENRTVHV